MSNNLQKQQEAFKRALARQPIIVHKPLAPDNVLRSTPSPSNANISFGTLPKHYNTYIHAAISHLRAYREPMTIDSLMNFLEIEKNKDQEAFIIEKIKVNSRVQVDLNKGFIQYKPLYDIKTEEDIISTLRNDCLKRGLLVKELREVFNDINKVINDLSIKRKILVLRGKEEGKEVPVVVYYNDTLICGGNGSIPSQIHPDIIKLWHSSKPPLDEDLLRTQMRQANVSPINIASTLMAKHAHHAFRISKNQGKRSSSFKRKINVTNMHVPEISSVMNDSKQNIKR